MSKDEKSVISAAYIIFLLTFALSILVPYQGDDVWLNYFHSKGFGFALAFFKWSYLHHVSRPSDFIAMLLGDDSKLFCAIFSGFFTLLGIVVIFILGIGKIPLLDKKEGRVDGFILLTIFFGLFLFNSSAHINKAIFSLAPSVPQLTAILPASFLIPYLLLFRGTHFPQDTLKVSAVFLFWGLISGFTVEYVPPAVAVTIILCLSVIALIQKKSIPKWCWIGLLGLLIGWLFIILAPGPYERAHHQINSYFALPFYIKFFRSFLYTFQGFLIYRKWPLLLTLFLWLLAWRKGQKNLLIPILLIMTCWLSDQAFTFGVGHVCIDRVIFSGNIFLFAALFCVAEPYFQSIRGKPIFLFIFAIFSLKMIFSAYMFHLQGHYRNDIIKTSGFSPAMVDKNYRGIGKKPAYPIVIPSYIHMSSFLIKYSGQVCAGRTRNLCIFGLLEGSISVERAMLFFVKQYATYDNYLHAIPLDKANISINGPAAVITNARWFPVTLPFQSGYRGVLKGILFVDMGGDKNYRNLCLLKNRRNLILKEIIQNLDINFFYFNNPAYFKQHFKLAGHPNIIALPVMRSLFPETFSLVIRSSQKKKKLLPK